MVKENWSGSWTITYVSQGSTNLSQGVKKIGWGIYITCEVNANDLIRGQSLKFNILNSINPKMYGVQVLFPSLFTWACLFAGLALSGWQYLISSICQGFGQFNTGYSLPIFVFVTLTLYLHSHSQPYLLLCWISGCLGKVVILECL